MLSTGGAAHICVGDGMQNVEHQFSEVARNPQTTFLGNIRVGIDVQLAELRELYSGVREIVLKGHFLSDTITTDCLKADTSYRYVQVVLAYGAESDRKLSIPGEVTPLTLPAIELFLDAFLSCSVNDEVYTGGCRSSGSKALRVVVQWAPCRG